MPVTQIRSCLPYIVRIYQTDFIFLSLWLPGRTSESRVTFLYSTHSCNFFCGDIKTVALKRFYYTGIESVACFFFCPCGYDKNSFFFFANSDSFRRVTQPDQLSQSGCSGGLSDQCSDKKFTTWRIVVVPSAQRRGPEWFYFGQNRQRDEIQRPATEFYVRFVLLLWLISLWIYNRYSIWCAVTYYVFCKKKERKKKTWIDFELGLSTRRFTVL